jgi:hypothetical protein
VHKVQKVSRGLNDNGMIGKESAHKSRKIRSFFNLGRWWHRKSGSEYPIGA